MTKIKTFFWEWFHYLIANPLVFFTRNADWATRLQEYSRQKVWTKEASYESGYTMLLTKVNRAQVKKSRRRE